MSGVAISGFTNMKALSRSGVSRPFDEGRDGFVLSEGAGVLVLEAWEHASSRGATILGELMGSASLADAHHITAPAPAGRGAIRCMERAMQDAQLQPGDIAHINAHGTSTALNDEAEATGIGEVFGFPGPIVTSIKGVTGHSLGAAGALEAVAVVLSMQKRLIPPTDGLLGEKQVDHCRQQGEEEGDLRCHGLILPSGRHTNGARPDPISEVDSGPNKHHQRVSIK